MKTMRLTLLWLCAPLLAGLAACGGGGGSNGGGQDPTDFTVTISPTTANVTTGETRQFSATVANPNNTGVTWGVYGDGNCQGETCGTITTAGLYTAPLAVPNPATVHVSATSKDDATKSASATVTIQAGIVVSVSPLTANVSVGGTQQFSALVQNTTNTAVTWGVVGSGCTGAACGTISTDGLYTAPGAVPNPPTVTVTATSQADTRRSGAATVTIGGSSLDKLNGHFAFLLSGFDADGPMHAAGSFVADGNGHLTNGLQDVNRISGPKPQVAFTGTYTIGADDRGELVFTSSLGTSKFRFALTADATEARVIEFDTTATRSSGVFIRQDPLDFSNSTIADDYVMSLSGGDLDGRVAAIGKFHADAAGHYSDGMMDINDGSSPLPPTAIWSGTYTVSGANGRGTAAIDIAGLGTINFAFYIVFTSHSFISEVPAMFFVSMDPLSAGTPLLSGPIYQALPFAWANYSNDTWSSEGLKVFTLAGKVHEGGTRAIAGTFQGDGAGHLQNGVFDQNRAGSVSASSNFGGTYDIDSSGRGTATIQLSATETLPISFYLASSSRAVLLGATGTDVLQGFLWPMGPGGSPGYNGVFSGDYASGPFALPAAEMMMFSGVLNADGAGHFSGTQDISNVAGLSAGEGIAGTYAFGARGRATADLAGGGQTAIYMVSTDAHVAISIDPTDENPMVLIIKRCEIRRSGQTEFCPSY